MDLTDEKTINLYEKAAAQNTYNKSDLFDIYKRFLFNINQYLNVKEVYSSLAIYKARALIYQSVLLTENLQKKFDLIILLNNLFKKDNIENAFSEASDFSKLLENITERNKLKPYPNINDIPN